MNTLDVGRVLAGRQVCTVRRVVAATVSRTVTGATAEEAAHWISALCCPVATAEANEALPTGLSPKFAMGGGEVAPSRPDDVVSP